MIAAEVIPRFTRYDVRRYDAYEDLRPCRTRRPFPPDVDYRNESKCSFVNRAAREDDILYSDPVEQYHVKKAGLASVTWASACIGAIQVEPGGT